MSGDYNEQKVKAKQLTPMDMIMPSQNRQTPVESTSAISLDDPANIDWNALMANLQLTPEEVQMLQVPEPGEGRSLADRLQALRPQMNLGGMNIQLEDNGISGSLRF